MSFFFIAGEPSGDAHAARLVATLRSRLPEARFAGLGGDAMRQEGVTLYQDYREMAFMGVVAVLKNLSNVMRNFQIAQEALIKEQPDVLVLVDYPSFNLRMATFCKKHLPKTKVVWYIAPKVWAWKRWRVHKIARYSDLILGIFPFEPHFYARYGYKCLYVGNPTVEACARGKERSQPARKLSPFRNYIAVLPGSRRSEIEHCLPRMIRAAREAAPNSKVIIAGTPALPRDIYSHLAPGVDVVFGETYDLLAGAEAAVVNSGTATLEASLLGCPQVAVYHIAVPHAVYLASLLFSNPVGDAKPPFFTLPNIILGREVIKELIGARFTTHAVAAELRTLLSDSIYRSRQTADYKQICATLGDNEASSCAADRIMEVIN